LDDFFQGLDDAVQHVLIALAVVILLAALLAIIPYSILEWWSWKKLKYHARLAEEALHSMEKPDFLELAQIMGSPVSYKISTLISARFQSQKTKVLIRWLFYYVTHTPALLVLAIAIASFISCLFQVFLVNEVRKAAPELVTDIQNLEDLVSSKIQNASSLWIDGTNRQISNIELQINNNLLGWAQESTLSLNNTLNTCNLLRPPKSANVTQLLTLL
jgi:hypothetical protein